MAGRGILLVVFVSLLSCASAQDDDSASVSGSASDSESNVDINNQNPCSFRGTFLLHKQSTRLDPCTLCPCFNGTTKCKIESCPSEAGCKATEIVVIPEECCPQCPYKMTVDDTNNLYDQTFEFTEEESKKIRFDLDIAVDRKLTSRIVRGENLWKLSAWVSPNEDGSGAKYSFEDNIFNDKDAAKEYSKPNYPPWEWYKMRYTMDFTGGTCADYKYFCVQFGQADDPRPTYDLSFNFQAVDNEEHRLIDCVPLGECKVDINNQNPCSFRGTFLLHKQSTRLDPCTLCTCFNGTTKCEIESCPSEAGCEATELVVIPHECCRQCPYKMFVEGTNNLYADMFDFTERERKNIRFDLDILVDRKLTSIFVRGENLWKLSAWVSPNEDGSGKNYSFEDNIFNDTDAAKEYNKPNYPPWEWYNLRYTMDFTGGTCADYKYFCIRFGQADDPRPTYNLSFTFQAMCNREGRLTDCVPLGECKVIAVLSATNLMWELTAVQGPIYGEETALSIDVRVSFTGDSANTNAGEGLWRIGMFVSESAEGNGERISEVYQTLNEEQASTTKKGPQLDIYEIASNFEVGAIGCGDVQYFCVEFAKGDDPDPQFTMTVNSSDTLITCITQECLPRAIFSDLVPDLIGDFTENRNNAIQMNLHAITDKLLSTNVSGSDLWEIGYFFSATANGTGPRSQPQEQILSQFNQDIDLVVGEDLKFTDIAFQTDLTGLLCANIPFICFELKNDAGASIIYTFGTNPTKYPFVECVDFSKVCKVDINNQNPCSFRGSLLLHKHSTRLDSCTECTCFNGTTTCEIESCPSDAGCEATEIVVIPQECCPQCPYTMFILNTNNLYDQTFEFTEGESKTIQFKLDIAVDRRLTSTIVRGENLWKLSAWVSPNEDGSGKNYSFEDNIFNDKDAAKEYNKPNYPPWEWYNLRYTMTFTGGTCADYKYFCIRFRQADDPRPTYNLSFTLQVSCSEEETLIDCTPLGECKVLTATVLNWTLTEVQPPVYGEKTAISLNVTVSFTKHSANKKVGEGLWRVGMFGSESPEGDGPRINEVYQTLNEEKASTTKKGPQLHINKIASDFELGTIGCVDVQYVCVEFAKGDDPDPQFTMTVESSDTLIKCKEQECSAHDSSVAHGLSGVIILVLIVCLTAMLIFPMIFILILLKRRKRRLRRRHDDFARNQFVNENIREVDPLLRSKEIHPSQVKLEHEVGKGEFGVVYKGAVTGLAGNPDTIAVAVKTIKGASTGLQEELLDEMKLLASLGEHRNILSLVACCSRRDPVYLITDFMKYGNLLGFLRKCREEGSSIIDPIYSFGEIEQIIVARDIANGMAHMEEQRIYHGDMAARNVLVGEGLEIKISDFGMSDDIYARGYKRQEQTERKIPVKWCSPETIFSGICSSKSDVWSFGVVLHEIFTLGGTPYPGMALNFFVNKLKYGYRMEKADNCPDDVYEMMVKCWNTEPRDRPRFSHLFEEVGELLTKRCDYFQCSTDEELLETDGAPLPGAASAVCELLHPIDEDGGEVDVMELLEVLKDHENSPLQSTEDLTVEIV